MDFYLNKINCKRSIDIIISLVLLIVLSPLFVLVSLLVLINLGSPVFFRQRRPGKTGVPFKLIKFRTMSNSFDSNGIALDDSQRLKTFGLFLRSTSLDELPSLWSVLIGDMSLVGPRPLLMEYLPLYTTEQFRRHNVRPGITGWAQVNGRNAISWEEKFQFDTWYVDNQSFLLDMKIIWMTIKKVIAREGISADGEVTMSKFLGSSVENSNKW